MCQVRIVRFVWPFWQIPSKDLSPRGILNSAIPFLIASTFQRIYPYQRTAFRGTEDLFSAVGNGNGATGRPVAFPNFRSRETGRRMPIAAIRKRAIRIYLTTCPMYNWRVAKFAPYQCKRRVYVKQRLTIFAERDISDSLLIMERTSMCRTDLFNHSKNYSKKTKK